MASNAYIVSALKHRPTTFAEVLAQDHITRTLKHSLERCKIANAYLFVGPRGTGKTTTARILAKALNCTQPNGVEPCNHCDSCASITRGNSIDVLEIDAASNRGINEMKALRESARFAPTGKYKVYIIDEVHMLSTDANNALLKTLEEPPANTRFIMATTELHKMMDTILSRCQVFQFRRIPTQIIVDHLKRIVSQQSDLEIADPQELDRILFHIARASEGGLRDALVSLDQMLAFCSGKLTLAEVEESLGVIEFDALGRFIHAIFQQNLPEILSQIHEIINLGKDINVFLKECLLFLRNIAVVKVSPGNKELLDLPEDYIQQLNSLAEETSLEQILYITDVFWETERRMRFSSEPRIIMEISAIKAAKAGQAVKIKDLLQKISSGGSVSLPAAAVPVSKPTAVPSEAKVAFIGGAEPGILPTQARNGDSPAQSHRAKPAVVAMEEARQETPQPDPVKPSTPPPSVGMLSASWEQILREIEQKNPIISATLQNSLLVDWAGDKLRIAIPAQNGFYLKTLEKPVNKKALSDILAEHFGKTFSLQFETRDDILQSAPESSVQESEQNLPTKKELIDRVQRDTIFNKLMDEIPGHIIAIEPERG